MSKRETATVLRFPADGVRARLAHALASERHRPTFEQLFDPQLRHDGKPVPDDVMPAGDDVDVARVPAGLWLVADDGVYLMSNALALEPGGRHAGGMAAVTYALGLDPHQESFDDWWERKVAAMGGDDQCLFLSAGDVSAALDSGRSFVDLKVWNNGMYVTALAVLL